MSNLLHVLKEGVLEHTIPDNTARECNDCHHCRFDGSGQRAWWCTSIEAFAERKTHVPGIKNCNYWKPCRTAKQLSLWERWFKRDDFVYKHIFRMPKSPPIKAKAVFPKDQTDADFPG